MQVAHLHEQVVIVSCPSHRGQRLEAPEDRVPHLLVVRVCQLPDEFLASTELLE